MLRTVLLSLGVVPAPWPGLCAIPYCPAGVRYPGHVDSPSRRRPPVHPQLSPDRGWRRRTNLDDRPGQTRRPLRGYERRRTGVRRRRLASDQGGASGSVRSLAIDESGRIYVGGGTTFGYLVPDEQGELQYVALDSRLPQEARKFNDVWRTFATKEGMLFQTERTIFRWAHESLSIIPAASRFNRASLVDDRLYLTTPEAGLNVLEGDTLRALAGTERLAREPFPVILRYDDKRLLVGTRSDGLFLYDGAALVPFPTELDQHFKTTQIYRGIVLPDQTIALTSTTGGLSVIDRQGRRVSQVARPQGLSTDVVYFVMPDREGGLWLGLDSGIARVETPAPVTFFDQTSGLPSLANRAFRHENRLYVATQTGVYYLNAIRWANRQREDSSK